MHGRLLAIDAGNSRLKFGLFAASQAGVDQRVDFVDPKIASGVEGWPQCLQFLAIPADDPIPWNTLTEWKPDGSVVAGSNPRAVDRVLAEWPESNLDIPFIVRDRTLISISVDVDFPDKVGLDRLLNAVAANVLRPSSRPAIVIDSGTATTVNFVSGQGVFSGGAILPGLEMSAKALNYYTAALPLLPVHELGGTPPVMPGRNTREAIRNGLLWGQVGAIRELVNRICHENSFQSPARQSESDCGDPPWMILTGGGSPVLSPHFPNVPIIPSLGMHGLVLTAWQKMA